MNKQFGGAPGQDNGRMTSTEKVHVPEIVSPIEGLELSDKLKLEMLLTDIVKTKGVTISESTKIIDINNMARSFEAYESSLNKININDISASVGSVLAFLRKDLKKIPGHYGSK